MPVHTRRFTADELADFPDDGNRYEVIDGELFVTPEPLIVHQRVHMKFILQLASFVTSCRLELLEAPTGVRASPVTEVQPDLLVFSGAVDDEENARQVRMSSLRLAVEILSPPTMRLDRVRKRKAYLDGAFASTGSAMANRGRSRSGSPASRRLGWNAVNWCGNLGLGVRC